MTFCGSPEYLSPEMLMCQNRSEMLDLYSIGAVFYEFVVGAPPFYNENQDKMFNDIMNKQIEQGEINGLTSKCQDLILRLLEKDPEK